ncbi:galectin-3 [Eucyclogobius newberryi]|uniref:galectin-3 n=1 Tax=Eucyclogobius newberryi TaxID=166745 RepID=UPI003B5C3D75
MSDFSLLDALGEDSPKDAKKIGNTNPSAPSAPANPGWPGSAPGAPSQPSGPGQFPSGSPYAGSPYAGSPYSGSPYSGPGAPSGPSPGQPPAAPGGFPPPGPGAPGQYPPGAPGAPGQFPPHYPPEGVPGQLPGGPMPYPSGPFASGPGAPAGPYPNVPFPGAQPGVPGAFPPGPGAFPPFASGGFPPIPPGSWGAPAGGGFPPAPAPFGPGPVGPYGGPMMVPFDLPLHAGILPRLVITIEGEPVPGAERFQVDLMKGSDVVFHLNPRFPENTIVRNSNLGGFWGPEEREGPFPFVPGQRFELKILVEEDMFKVAVDGTHLLEYEHRVGGLEEVTLLRIMGDVVLYSASPSMI